MGSRQLGAFPLPLIPFPIRHPIMPPPLPGGPPASAVPPSQRRKKAAASSSSSPVPIACRDNRPDVGSVATNQPHWLVTVWLQKHLPRGLAGTAFVFFILILIDPHEWFGPPSSRHALALALKGCVYLICQFSATSAHYFLSERGRLTYDRPTRVASVWHPVAPAGSIWESPRSVALIVLLMSDMWFGSAMVLAQDDVYAVGSYAVTQCRNSTTRPTTTTSSAIDEPLLRFPEPNATTLVTGSHRTVEGNEGSTASSTMELTLQPAFFWYVPHSVFRWLALAPPLAYTGSRQGCSASLATSITAVLFFVIFIIGGFAIGVPSLLARRSAAKDRAATILFCVAAGLSLPALTNIAGFVPCDVRNSMWSICGTSTLTSTTAVATVGNAATQDAAWTACVSSLNDSSAPNALFVWSNATGVTQTCDTPAHQRSVFLAIALLATSAPILVTMLSTFRLLEDTTRPLSATVARNDPVALMVLMVARGARVIFVGLRFSALVSSGVLLVLDAGFLLLVVGSGSTDFPRAERWWAQREASEATAVDRRLRRARRELHARNEGVDGVTQSVSRGGGGVAPASASVGDDSSSGTELDDDWNTDDGAGRARRWQLIASAGGDDRLAWTPSTPYPTLVHRSTSSRLRSSQRDERTAVGREGHGVVPSSKEEDVYRVDGPSFPHADSRPPPPEAEAPARGGGGPRPVHPRDDTMGLRRVLPLQLAPTTLTTNVVSLAVFWRLNAWVKFLSTLAALTMTVVRYAWLNCEWPVAFPNTNANSSSSRGNSGGGALVSTWFVPTTSAVLFVRPEDALLVAATANASARFAQPLFSQFAASSDDASTTSSLFRSALYATGTSHLTPTFMSTIETRIGFAFNTCLTVFVCVLVLVVLLELRRHIVQVAWGLNAKSDRFLLLSAAGGASSSSLPILKSSGTPPSGDGTPTSTDQLAATRATWGSPSDSQSSRWPMGCLFPIHPRYRWWRCACSNQPGAPSFSTANPSSWPRLFFLRCAASQGARRCAACAGMWVRWPLCGDGRGCDVGGT